MKRSQLWSSRAASIIALRPFACHLFLYRAWAQTERGGIRGTVVDSTQAVIPGVAVIATHVDTGVVRTAETTGEGVYNLAALPGGTYRVEVVHPGMRTEVRENVRVTAASVTSLNFTLQVGTTQETVSVTADTLLQADTSTTGASLDTKAYADLPLTSGGSRRPNRFMLLVPGTAGNPTGFGDSIAGGQASTKEIQLEGASMVTQEISGDGRNVTFPPDAVEEVSVATAGYSAEYGNTGGGVERYVLKSGTNLWRGSLYEYLRNEAFDAAGFFDTVVPVHREHEWGGTFGGPIAKNKVLLLLFVQQVHLQGRRDRTVSCRCRLRRSGTATSRPGRSRFTTRRPRGRIRPTRPSSYAIRFPATSFRRTASIRQPRKSSSTCRCRTCREIIPNFNATVPKRNERADDVRGQGRPPIQRTSADEHQPRRDRRPGLYAKWITASGRRPADQGFRLLVPARHPRLGDERQPRESVSYRLQPADAAAGSAEQVR